MRKRALPNVRSDASLGVASCPTGNPNVTDEPQRTQSKQRAAEQAVALVQSGMTVGLGTGSTAIFATRRIAELLRTGALREVTGVATSERTAAEAGRLGIPLLDTEMTRAIDLTIDGADEIDPDLNLIKGRGGALLREKIVAEASRRVVIVADETKLSPRLGTQQAVPVEVLAFGWRRHARYLESLGALVELRQTTDGVPYQTDSGHLIVDCAFGPIADAAQLAARLKQHAGIVEHGLFLAVASDVIVAGRDGVRQLMRVAAEK